MKVLFFFLLLLSNLMSTDSFNPYPNKPRFLSFCSTSLLKTMWKKEKLLVTSNFSFSHNVFYLFGEISVTFIEIVANKLFQFGRVFDLSFRTEVMCLEIVVWSKGNHVFSLYYTYIYLTSPSGSSKLTLATSNKCGMASIRNPSTPFSSQKVRTS